MRSNIPQCPYCLAPQTSIREGDVKCSKCGQEFEIQLVDGVYYNLKISDCAHSNLVKKQMPLNPGQTVDYCMDCGHQVIAHFAAH